jgi:hypothetical protein
MHKFRGLETMFAEVAELGFSETSLSGTLSNGEMTSFHFNRPAEDDVPELYLTVHAWQKDCFMSIDSADNNRDNNYSPSRLVPLPEVSQEVKDYLARFPQAA